MFKNTMRKVQATYMYLNTYNSKGNYCLWKCNHRAFM